MSLKSIALFLNAITPPPLDGKPNQFRRGILRSSHGPFRPISAKFSLEWVLNPTTKASYVDDPVRSTFDSYKIGFKLLYWRDLPSLLP
ncbi:hypothetical protein PoB_006657300 [Plakobranchus ocellatus]|uniref:Uncharacterized protein n=1 Tax=Plakobranchus ocellatus TaxID=259542 RepID=A0AAV4D7B6_9GAST|nr:hypothetical protein PoB_006657300 [Plakobranchus ocellatus]